jgi:hypothetical protein
MVVEDVVNGANDASAPGFCGTNAHISGTANHFSNNLISFTNARLCPIWFTGHTTSPPIHSKQLLCIHLALTRHHSVQSQPLNQNLSLLLPCSTYWLPRALLYESFANSSLSYYTVYCIATNSMATADPSPLPHSKLRIIGRDTALLTPLQLDMREDDRSLHGCDA